MTKAARRMALVSVLAVGLLGGGTGEAIAAKAGPVTAKCGKLKGQAAKSRCLKQNQANRIAFNQIKDSRFVGARGDGAGIEDVYCASGKYESRTSDSEGTGVSTGSRWVIHEAVVRQGGKWIDAFLEDPAEGFEIALQRRGTTWKLGVASLGRILDPGVVTKTNATTTCATL